MQEHKFEFLSLFFYVAIQSCVLQASIFPADDINEFNYVGNALSGAWFSLFSSDSFHYFRPVKNLLFLIFAGLRTFGMPACRLLAIAIGIASFFPVLALCRRVIGRDAGTLAAAVWLLSPTLVSSVAWLSCVNIQAMVAFAALALVQHDRERTPAALLCMLLAMFSYESAIMLGPIAVAFDFYLRPERFRSVRAWRRYGLYAALSVAYLALRFLSASHLPDYASEEVGWNCLASKTELMSAAGYFTLLHLRTWLWPFGRMAVYATYQSGDVSVAVRALCWAAVLGLSFLSLSLRRRRPTVGFSIALFFLAFLPTSNALGFGNGPYGDYYLGVASIGLSLLIAEAAAWLWAVRRKNRILAPALLAALVVWRGAAGVEAARWADCWADPEKAFANGLKIFPKSFNNMQALANLYCDSDRPVDDGHPGPCRIADRLQSGIRLFSHSRNGKNGRETWRMVLHPFLPRLRLRRPYGRQCERRERI